MTTTLSVHAGAAVQQVPSWAAAGAPGPWLIVVPHDDDLVLGMGLCVAAALAQGIQVEVAIVSDGRMGYAQPQEQPGLVARRAQEMAASCALLGLDGARLHALGYPDGSLPQHQGARRDQGCTSGIAYDLCRILRQVRPATVFGPTRADLHPDHVAVASELAISCFHAAGEIWLELGSPLPRAPVRFDYAVYCPFPGQPTLALSGSAADLGRKLRAIAAFASQRQIESLVAAVAASGAHEYLQRQPDPLYPPASYPALFQLNPAGAANPAATPPASAPGAGFAADCARVGPLLERWPQRAWAPLVAALAASPSRPLALVGEGSSRLFPAALLRTLAAQAPSRLRVLDLGGREAEALPVAAYQLLLVSNSGQSREPVELLARLPRPLTALSIVGVAGGPLHREVTTSLVLLEEPERAVAATVSVFAQAMCLAHAACEAAQLAIPWERLRAGVAAAQAIAVPAIAPGRTRLWWSGPEGGAAGELALKTMETVGCLGVHLPGTMALHGIEEVLGPEDLLISLQGDARDQERLRERITATGAQLVCMGAQNEIGLPDLGAWNGLIHLVAGWRLLGAWAQARGRDADRPRRARKIGNEHVASPA